MNGEKLSAVMAHPDDESQGIEVAEMMEVE